jgi:SAM-dependent methyltransferase
MSFSVAAADYDRFMGRYSVPLASLFADFAGVANGWQVLDVGCGPGALTRELVDRLGPDAISAVDPSESFVAAATERLPGVNVRHAAAEQLPFEDGQFDAALAQLVVHFMSDPVAGLREMGRVARPGGTVAACVWDHAGGRGPLSPLWDSARELDSSAEGESFLAGSRHGHLAELFETVGLHEVHAAVLEVDVQHPTFDEWWEPFTLGVGPAGGYVMGLDPEKRDRLKALCRERLPPAPFVVSACAWSVRGHA